MIINNYKTSIIIYRYRVVDSFCCWSKGEPATFEYPTRNIAFFQKTKRIHH